MVNPERMNTRAHIPPERQDRIGSETADVWVLDDPRAGTSAQAIGIAEQLGLPFRRIGVSFNWWAHAAGLARRGSLTGLAESRGGPLVTAVAALAGVGGQPRLVLSAGSRAAPVALWLKDRLGCRIVHCMRPGLGGLFRWGDFDLLVVPEHDSPGAAGNVIPVLGAPHRVSPAALRAASLRWRDRLDHLPHPVVALLVGGPVRGANLEPARAHSLGVAVARAAAAIGGSVVATTSRRTGTEAADALAAGLGRAMHLIYRWGEPGENPYLGFLAAADSVVVTADSVSMISEACATGVPVHIALPELATGRHRRLVASLIEAGQVRSFRGHLGTWSRAPLDEAGRVAAEIRARFGVR
jgi:mitochondrial fission protein ELM1